MQRAFGHHVDMAAKQVLEVLHEGDVIQDRAARPHDTRGWIVGDNATILFTEDSGQHWTKQAPLADVTSHLRAVYFATAKKGWAVGDDGIILATTDGGGELDEADTTGGCNDQSACSPLCSCS